MDTKEINPDVPILIESIRSIGYSFESALADIIDNSISKKANIINIRFSALAPQYVAIIDNGVGMDEEELFDAMKYGSKDSKQKRDETDLGRYGLGLKTASLSQCRRLTVISKKENHINAVEWDLDQIQKTNKWTLNVYSDEEKTKLPFYSDLAINESGTIVIWSNFDRLTSSSQSNINSTFDEKIDHAKLHIGLVFHRYLNGEVKNHQTTIKFNGIEIQPIDPFFSSNPATQPLEEKTIRYGGSKIKVKAFILPYVSKLNSKEKLDLDKQDTLKLNQGFYIYRNKRLIVWGSWFRMIKQSELNKLARVRIDIPNSLDDLWELDIKKSTATIPYSIKQELISVVKNAIGRSEKVYKYRGRKVNENSSIDYIWNVIEDRGKTVYRINKDNSLCKQIQNVLSDEGISLFNSFLTLVEDCFPFMDVYIRMTKAKDNNDSNSHDEDELFRTAIDYLNALIADEKDKALGLQKFLSSEFAKKHKDIAYLVEEKIKNAQ